MAECKRNDDLYNFPNDPNIARFGGRTNARYDPQIFTECAAATAGRQPPDHKGKRLGFIIHAHCWVLISRAIKVSPTEIKLENLSKLADLTGASQN